MSCVPFAVLCCIGLAVIYSPQAVRAASPCNVNSATEGIFIFPHTPTVFAYEGTPPDEIEWTCGSIPAGKNRRWLHNGAYVMRQSRGGIINRLDWTPTKLNDSGVYECQILNITNSTEEQDLNATVLSSCTITLTVIRVTVPAIQYAVYNKSFSLQCYSSYTVQNRVWKDSQNEVHNGSFNPVSLQDEGQYTCRLIIVGKSKTMGTQLFVIIPARISPLPPATVEVTGPNGVLSVTVRTDHPGTIRVTWYRADQPIMTENVTTTAEGDMTNTSTLSVSHRNESGEYRVVVGESRLPNVLTELPEDVVSMATHNVAFTVTVKVPPAVPTLSLQPDQTTLTVLWTHTNQIADDFPATITLTLTQPSGNPISTAIDPTLTNYTFTQLIPATSYSVFASASNSDGTVIGQPIKFNTTEAAPSVAVFTATRTNLNTFNFSVTFDYLGAASIKNITICYKPQGSSVAATCMAGILWQPDTSLLVWTATATISDPAIQSVKAEFSLLAFNTAELSCQHPPVNELLFPLSSPPQVTFKQINFTTAHLLVRLPMMGTPPILNLTVTVTYHITQDSHTKTKKGLFNNGEIVSVHFDKLLSGVRYTVMAVATNLLGSSNISTGMEFVTVATSATTSTISPVPHTPIWVIILSSILPAVVIMALVITTCLFFVCFKKFRVRRKEYRITPGGFAPPTNAAKNQLECSPGSTRRYFDHNRPLTPRSPFAETELSTVNISGLKDSDSESTNSHFPQYKYVVSPTPVEVGVQGFLGSTPGSGSYVYV